MTKPRSKSGARNERQTVRSRGRDDTQLLRLAANQNEAALIIKARNVPVVPLNDAQRSYDAAMRSAAIVFGVGPAGTGKTWLAAMRAAEALANKTIEKIIVTRPTVEVGDTLGFLPGELEEKNEPYFRPVRDALVEYFGSTHLDYLIKVGKIEARPLQLLRGATLKNCWLIADEMQNATPTQFKMLLSRIGENAKFIINGDPMQTDLPKGTSGLNDAQTRLKKVGGVEIITFLRSDIVRSGLCQAIVTAYETEDEFAGKRPDEPEKFIIRWLNEPVPPRAT